MKIVCIGDSLTYGYKVSRSKAWTAVAQRQTGAEIVNRGVTGDTTGGMLARFGREALEAAPDAVFIMGGLNDLIMGAPVGVVRANLSAMVHQALAARIVPALGAPVPMVPEAVRPDWRPIADFRALAGMEEEQRAWLGLFARTFGVRLVDFHDLFEGAQDPLGEFYLDGLHPNAAGNERMAERFSQELVEKLPRLRP